MKLNDKYEIVKIPHGYKMLKAVRNRRQKDGVMVDTFDEFFYGTMDQALVGFLNRSIECPETLDDLRVKVMSIKDEIVSLQDEILSQRGEIRTATP